MKPTLLLVDDEVRILRSLKFLFNKSFTVYSAQNGMDGLSVIKNHEINVVVSDQRMPGNSGVELLKQVKTISPATMRILLTGYSDLNAVLDSINHGEVYRYINKPWDNQDLIKTVTEAAKISQNLFNNRKGTSDDIEIAPPEILLLKDSLSHFERIQAFLEKKSYSVRVEDSLEGCLKAMEQGKVGIVVADISHASGSNQVMIKILKKEYPKSVAVVTSSDPDAQVAIDLINQGQVFRLVNIQDLEALESAFIASLRYHCKLSLSPAEAARHQVTELKTAKDLEIQKRFKMYLPAIRNRLRALGTSGSLARN